MKIIDNRKDYYDYMSGIWGIDNKITFDRRRFKTIDKYDLSVYKNIFNGSPEYIYDIWYGSRFKEIYYRSGWQISDKPTRNFDKPAWKNPDSLIKIAVYNISPNNKLWYWYIHSIKTYEDIILKDFSIIKGMIPAEELWQEMYSYLSSKYDKEIIDNRTDIQKLESAGFDKKISFRNTK